MSRVWFSDLIGQRERYQSLAPKPNTTFTGLISAGKYHPSEPFRVYVKRSGDIFPIGENLQAIPTSHPDALKVMASAPSQASRSLDTGSLLHPVDSQILDLVTTNRDRGAIEIREGQEHEGRFSYRVTKTIQVEGGPRYVKIVDLNADGWNDLVVVLRNFDRVVTGRNPEI
jgi:hypothetical protein